MKARMKVIQKTVLFCLMLTICSARAHAQFPGTAGGTNISLTGGNKNSIPVAFPFLLISPDARAASMGDAAAATPDDANAIHWNMAKYASNPKKICTAISYTPWLRNLLPDISLGYLAVSYKLNERSAIAASVRYFQAGSLVFITSSGPLTYQPKEVAFDAGYSYRLTKHFSLGITLRKIHSDVTDSIYNSQLVLKTADAFTGDLSAYYANKLVIKSRDKSHELNYAIGAAISNIGSPVSYTALSNQYFAPVNLRIGTYWQAQLTKYHSLALALDLNKLLVPSNTGNLTKRPLIGQMIQSFSDAPGGLKEELHEINIAGGLEYWYDKQFALRTGSFYEHQTKGNRKYLTFGTGFRFNNLGLDFSYLLPFELRSPLARTYRITLLFHITAPPDENLDSKRSKPVK